MTPGDYAKFMGGLAQSREARVQRGLRRAADQGAQLARTRTRQIGKVDTGAFASGWHAEDRGDGAAIVNRVRHAAEADDGQPAGGPPPPLPQLVRWVERHFHVGGHRAWALARAISQRIVERGTLGAEVAAWVGKKVAPIAAREVAKEIDR